ncbi:MAG TPA: DUF952 domain-containing protein [Acidimicrobiales bacterium]|nr:DUF952 domain-containing protein [Acidimicrobiales bacterium]
MAVIYHIALAAEWEEARRGGEYTRSTLGRSLAEVGFIHASTERQVGPVADMFYAGVSDLVVLVIDPDRVTAEIRYESVPGADEPFPHIYGPLDPDAVIDVRPLEPAADGRFTFEGF